MADFEAIQTPCRVHKPIPCIMAWMVPIGPIGQSKNFLATNATFDFFFF